MGRPAGVPQPQPDQPPTPADGGATQQEPGSSSLSATEATWWGLADSVYLASIMDRPESSGPVAAKSLAPKHVPPPPVGHSPPPGPEDIGPQEKHKPADHRAVEPVHDTVADRHAASGAGAEPELRLVQGEHRAESVQTNNVAAAAIVRALWPLKRSVKSWREDDLIFDAEATAERAVRDNLWWPVTKPASQRLFDLTVVIDGSPSMTLWRSQLTSFLSLLEHRGAFRTIQVRRLDTSTDVGGQPVLRGGTAHALARGSSELRDPSGRRMILVVTDGIDECWRQDLVGPVLARWGQKSQVCVVNLLPERMWSRVGMPVERVRLNQPPGVTANRRWSCELLDAWLRPKQHAVPAGAVPVPVVELEPVWLRWWAHLAIGAHRGAVKARVLLADAKPRPRVVADESPSVRELVSRFRGMASAEALKLATLLAAVPVSVPIARTLQEELAPECGPEHLAEVLASGLMRAPKPANWDEATFHIPAAARAMLLSGARRSRTAKAIHVAASRFGDEIPQLGRLRDALRDPDTTPDPVLAEEIAHDRVVMRALSGPYASRADRLKPMGPPQPTSSEPIRRSVQAPEPARTEVRTLPETNGQTRICSTPRRPRASTRSGSPRS